MDSSKHHDPFRPDSYPEATVITNPTLNLARLRSAGATVDDIEAIIADLAKLSPAATAVIVAWVNSTPLPALVRFVESFISTRSIEEAYNAPDAPETALDGPESASTVDPPSPPPETSSGATIAAEVAETISSIPQDVIDSTMATVQAMTVRQVDAQLRERSIEVKGNAAAKRMRLFQVVAAERAAGDPAAAELF